jgi:hypothetical protein
MGKKGYSPNSRNVIPPHMGVGGEYRVRQAVQTRSLAKATTAWDLLSVYSSLPHCGQTLLIGNLAM